MRGAYAKLFIVRHRTCFEDRALFSSWLRFHLCRQPNFALMYSDGGTLWLPFVSTCLATFLQQGGAYAKHKYKIFILYFVIYQKYVGVDSIKIKRHTCLELGLLFSSHDRSTINRDGVVNEYPIITQKKIL
ncbi:hypothetical protein ACJX0J_040824, partial [Zea mays]